MTKAQKYLIGAAVALLGLVVFLFRTDLFVVTNRPGVTAFLQAWVQPYGFGLSLLLFGYLLSKGLGIRGWIIPLLFVLWELVYVVVLHFGAGFLPERTKLSAWLAHFKGVALSHRSMIQFQEESAQYDRELFYTLKPGKSNFSSFEFSTTYDVNALGVRDDFASLDYPKVVFLGDSFTMGWGVEEAEAFPARFEALSGLRTLNTGISSYGTAREMRMLSRVRLDSLKAIVLQFHDTDLEENNYYVRNGKLGDRTAADFQAQVVDNRKYTAWTPFKYLKTAMVNGVAKLQGAGTTASDLTAQDEKFPFFLSEFFSIMTEIRELTPAPVIFTYTGSFYTDPGMINRFETFSKQHWPSNIYYVNLGPLLDHEDYFYFDDHLNAKGHKKVADAVWERFQEVVQ